jgi:hypothetical protein
VSDCSIHLGFGFAMVWVWLGFSHLQWNHVVCLHGFDFHLFRLYHSLKQQSILTKYGPGSFGMLPDKTKMIPTTRSPNRTKRIHPPPTATPTWVCTRIFSGAIRFRLFALPSSQLFCQQICLTDIGPRDRGHLRII